VWSRGARSTLEQLAIEPGNAAEPFALAQIDDLVAYLRGFSGQSRIQRGDHLFGLLRGPRCAGDQQQRNDREDAKKYQSDNQSHLARLLSG
jgi:hypothetical protein